MPQSAVRPDGSYSKSVMLIGSGMLLRFFAKGRLRSKIHTYQSLEFL